MRWVFAVLALVGVAIWLLWGRFGGLQDLFRGRSTPRRAPISTSILISGDSLIIDALDFRGPCLRSPNRKFTLGWADGRSDSGPDQGHIILLIDQQVILHRRLPHPITGAVSNIGTLAVVDRRSGPEPGAVFHVLSPYGDSLIRGRIRGDATSCGISNNGRFAVCHSVTEPDGSKSGMLHFFVMKMGPSGLKPGGLAWKVHTWTETPESYNIDIVRRQLTVTYADGSEYLYTFEGEIIAADVPDGEADDVQAAAGELDDPDEIEEQDHALDGRDLLGQAEDLLQQNEDDKTGDDACAAARELLTQVIELDLPDRFIALAHRRLGEIAERQDDPDEAISRYEQALDINPKVGVKTRLARLRKSPA